MAAILSQGRAPGNGVPVDVPYLTNEELEEWAALIVAAQEEPDGQHRARHECHEHEEGLRRVTAARAREDAFRVLEELPLDAAHREHLWQDLIAAHKQVSGQTATPSGAAAAVIRVLVPHFAPPLEHDAGGLPRHRAPGGREDPSRPTR